MTQNAVSVQATVPRPPTGSPGGNGKLAERVASAIRDDIERARWQVGSVVGSEAELRDRYGVTWAFLREAIRVLEQHNAVKTKRGPGAGLVVAQPDGAGVVRAAELVLEYENNTRADVLKAGAAIEVTSGWQSTGWFGT